MADSTPGGPPPGLSASDLPHDDIGPNIIAATFTTWSIAAVFVALRLWTRSRIVRRLGISDLFITLSLIAALGMCISEAVQVRQGMGKHIWDIEIFVVGPAMLEAWWFSVLTYLLTLSLTKISILTLYLTIFTLEWARRACYFVLVVVVILALWGIASAFTNCIPLQATWDYRVEATFCQSQEMWWANTGTTILTDLMIFMLPIPSVLPLKLPRRQKFVVVGVFTVGFFVCLVSLIRLVILIQAKGDRDPDWTYTNTTLTYWTLIETHTAITVACAMTLKPFVAKVLPRLLAPRSLQTGSDQPSAAVSGSGPPLTIGSKPLRSPLTPRHARTESWMETAAAATAASPSGPAGGRHGIVGGAVVREIGSGQGEGDEQKAEVGAESSRSCGSSRTAVTGRGGLDDACKVSVRSRGASTVNIADVDFVPLGTGS